MKIFKQGQNPDSVLYSESYVVTFRILDDNGFWKKETKRYFTASKGKHKEIEKQWRKEFPNADFINVVYE